MQTRNKINILDVLMMFNDLKLCREGESGTFLLFPSLFNIVGFCVINCYKMLNRSSCQQAPLKYKQVQQQ